METKKEWGQPFNFRLSPDAASTLDAISTELSLGGRRAAFEVLNTFCTRLLGESGLSWSDLLLSRWPLETPTPGGLRGKRVKLEVPTPTPESIPTPEPEVAKECPVSEKPAKEYPASEQPRQRPAWPS